MMTFLAVTRVPSKPAALAGAAVLAVLFAGAVVLEGQTTTYTLYSPEGRRAFVLRAGSPETFALEQLSGVFGLTFTEDRLANGLVIGTRKDRIVAVPGQSFIQVGGRVVGLDGPIRRERNSWMAPVDFLTKALAPAIGEPVVIRRTSRLILIGNVRVPQVSGKIERTTVGARVVLSIQPSTPHKVTREGNRLFLRFDAVALDATAISGTAPEFVGPSRVDGAAMIIELGPSAATFRAEDDRSRESLTIELLPAAPVASLPPPTAGGRPLPPPPPPQFELMPGLRTIVLDPGHGGDDAGTRGASGVEKDVALQFARRLKAAIEGRFGLRVLLTRDADENVPVDRRTAFANHNNADLFLSLHANSSVRSTARGVQVWSLDAGDYAPPTPAAEARRKTVPLLGGGTRIIDPMPWDLAQLPFAEQSATFGSVLIRQFTERAVPLHHRPVVVAPVRVLAGANMPALLIELGFLSNADDEKLLANAESQAALVESILAAIAEFRRGFPAPEGGRRP